MRSKNHKRLVDLIILTMLGVIMFISKYMTEALPNIHLLGMLTMTYTITYRKKALIPVYVFVFLTGLFNGFALWWIPYLYIWTILWAVTMLLPKNMSNKIALPVYSVVCAFHGLCYGVLYAPAQAILYGLDFKGMVAWIIAGLPWDAIHAVGNLVLSLLIIPLSAFLKEAHKTAEKD